MSFVSDSGIVVFDLVEAIFLSFFSVEMSVSAESAGTDEASGNTDDNPYNGTTMLECEKRQFSVRSSGDCKTEWS